MNFEYRAKNEDGEIKSGALEASSEGEALVKLQDKGLYVLSVEKSEIPFYKRDFEINLDFLERISDDDIILFSRQLGILLDSQIGMVEALRILSKQIDKKTLKRKINDIADRVEEGDPFSGALKKHRDVFSDFYIGAVESGEASGSITDSLEYLEEHLERSSQFRKKLIGAMVYPFFIIFVFSFVVIFLLVFVIPDIVEMIEELDAEMPFVTQVVISVSDFVVAWGWLALLGFIGGVIAFGRFLKTTKGKRAFDQFILKVPAIGGFFKKIYITYFTESLSTLISSGLDIVKALEVTENIVKNEVYKDIVAETKQDVKEGKEISDSLKKHPQYFPGLVTQMIVVGERTGRMEKVLNSVVNFYRDQVERTMEMYIKIAEPALIIMLGIVVGGLVMSVLLPIYNVGMGM